MPFQLPAVGGRRMRRVAAVLFLGLLQSYAVSAGDKEHIVVYAHSWFQARGTAFSNVVIIPYDGPDASTVDQALKLPGARRMTIQGDLFLGQGEQFTGTLDEDKRRLTLEFTNDKGKPKTKNFKLFSPEWTSPSQIR